MMLKDADPKHYDRTFIVYYLPGMQVGAGGWATGHFDPNLKVVIQGLTTEQERALAAEPEPSNGGVVGRWLDDRPYVGNRISIVQERGELVMERKYKDGSSSKTKLVERSVSSGRRFEEPGSPAGEYYLINAQGGLQIWDADGLIATAKKIE